MEKKEKTILPPTPKPWPIHITGKDFTLYLIIGVLCLLLIAVTHEAANHIQELHTYYQTQMDGLGCSNRNPNPPFSQATPILNLSMEGQTWKP